MLRADTRPAAVFLMGATASGKTALALELARRFPLAAITIARLAYSCPRTSAKSTG